MTIALRGNGALLTGTTSPLTPDIDAIGASAGDLILLVAGAYATGTSTITSTGYTADGSAVSTPPTPDLNLKELYRIFVGGDTDPSVANANSPGNGWGALMLGFSGVDNVTPLDATTVSAAVASSTSPQPTGITTVTNNAMVVSLIVTTLNTSGGVTVGTANGFTTILSGASYVDTTRALAFAMAYKLQATAGAVTCPTYSQASSKDSVGITLALRPATVTTVMTYRNRGLGRGLTRGVRSA